MIPQLRDYQIKARSAVLEQFRNDVRRVLLVMPTGAGKGTLAANVVASTEAAGNRCIFMVNRRELVKDMSKRLRKLGVDHGVIMAGANDLRNPLARTIVASKDTVQRRKKPPADLVFIDEAHFAVSDGWADILKAYEDSFILGMTATPIRLEGRGLGEFFDVIVNGNPETPSLKLPGQAKLSQEPSGSTSSAPSTSTTSPGSTVETTSTGPSNGGQLNPRHASWLMGLPPIFDLCIVAAINKLKNRPKKSKEKKGKK